MPTYEVTFIVTTDADDEDEAVAYAKDCISQQSWEAWEVKVIADLADYEDEPAEPILDDPTFPQGQTVKVAGYDGIAWVVRQVDPDGKLVCRMVGDDRLFRFDRDELTLLDREEFCGECGQIGCTHDGLDRG